MAEDNVELELKKCPKCNRYLTSLTIDEESKKVIKEFCSKCGWSKSSEIIKKEASEERGGGR